MFRSNMSNNTTIISSSSGAGVISNISDGISTGTDLNQTSMLLLSCQANLTSIISSYQQCTSNLDMLQMNVTDISGQLTNCSDALAAAAGGGDAPADEVVIYNQGLHVAAVFIIFAASLF